MFSTDRSNKYGWGAIRLVALTAGCIRYFDPNLILVGTNMRWLSFVLLGGIGAVVNVSIISPMYNMLLLALCGIAIGFDLQSDATMAIYLFKTLGGDFIAGKLDTLEWQISGIFAFIVAVSCAVLSETVMKDYGRIFSLLFAMQVLCEYGDNHWERFKFFRHRYSFELIHTLILFNLPAITEAELRVILMDLIACSAYRSSNYAIIVLRKLLASDFLISAPRMALYHIRGFLQGFRVEYVREPDLAVAVMKHSDCKGYVLERVLSCPAWAPIISLESIDGRLWTEMRQDFSILLKSLGGAEKLKKIAKKHLDALSVVSTGSTDIIDANTIALLTMKVFVEFLFDREWETRFDILVLSSWEWRKEIAARGDGDVEVKRRAIEMTLLLIKESPLSSLFGGKWDDPKYYSLILQPFLISPTINTGDLAVAFNRYPDKDVTECMREMHPFPILERWISNDLIVEGKAPTSFPTSFSTSSTTSNTAVTTSITSTAEKSSGKCPFSIMSKKDNITEQNTVNNTNITLNYGNEGSEKDERNKYENSSPRNPHLSPVPTPSPSHVGVKGRTQVVMFPSDWRSDSTWPVFGAGKRACPGAHFALPWLTQLRESLLKIKAEEISRKDFNGVSRVQPEKNHLYSGRNNDDKVNFSEIFYFFSRIIPKVLFTSKLGGGEDCDLL